MSCSVNLSMKDSNIYSYTVVVFIFQFLKREYHLYTVGGFLGNSKGMAWKTESMQNMGV